MPRTDEELRSAGWEEDAIRGYRRGAEDVKHGFANVTMPGAAFPEPDLPAFTAARLPRVTAKGHRGTWMRNTPAGMLTAVVSPDGPDDAARERAAARSFIDDYEFTYGMRPTMLEAQYAVRPRGGLTVSGTAAEIGRVFATAGLQFGTQVMVEPLPDPGQVVVVESPYRG